MKTVRCILFIPTAFVASLIIGALTHIVADSFFDLPWLAWSISGGFSAYTIVILGIKIAPGKNLAVKWVLIVITVGFGLMSAIGGFFVGDDPDAGFAGVSMIVVGVICSRVES